MRPFNDSVIYFAVVDRFFNSDPANDTAAARKLSTPRRPTGSSTGEGTWAA